MDVRRDGWEHDIVDHDREAQLASRRIDDKGRQAAAVRITRRDLHGSGQPRQANGRSDAFLGRRKALGHYGRRENRYSGDRNDRKADGSGTHDSLPPPLARGCGVPPILVPNASPGRSLPAISPRPPRGTTHTPRTAPAPSSTFWE